MLDREFDKRRRQLLENNIKAWDGDDSVFPTSKLDSSLKKNTSVIKKLRVLSHDSETSLLKDISTTSLEKYLSELISATIEGLLRCKKDEDFYSAVEITSALHQRFTIQFTPVLLSELLFGISNPPKIKGEVKIEKEEIARINKQKIYLRLITELLFVGVFQNNVDEICDRGSLPDFINKKLARSIREPLLVSVLKEVLSYNHKSGISISLITGYLKKFADHFQNEDLTFMTADTKESIVTLFESYTDLIFDRTSLLHSSLEYQMDKNKKIAMKTGKIVEGIEQQVEDLEKLFEKFKVFSKFLGETFNKEVPDFEASQLEETDSIITGLNVFKAKEHDTQIWETEEIKKFYTDIPDLSNTIAQDVLNYKASESNTDQNDAVSMGEKMSRVMDMLDNCSSLKDVDNAVYEFWYMKLNNKASRNRFFKFLIETSDLFKLKYYSRFIAINKNYLTDLKDEVIKYLDGGFRSQIHTNRLNFKNIAFFCELIKFKLIPIHVLFHKIRSLILNITVQNNIEILGLFFENCGKLLLHDPEYQQPMAEMLELLKEKRQKGKLTSTERYSVDTMLLIIQPPSVKLFNRKVVKLSPEEEFLITLMRSELNDQSWPDVLNILRKIDFIANDVLFQRLKELLTRPDMMNFNGIRALAKIIRYFTTRSRKLRVFVIDTVIEKIQRDLEVNDYRNNRIRLANVTLLAELSNEDLINVNVIINILYRILCFGHPNNNPTINQTTPLDTPDNYFRLSLVCQILVTLDMTKLRLKQKEKLELFLCYFDYYCNVKKQPIPQDTNFKIFRMLEKVKPDYVRAKNLRQAVENLQGMLTLMNVDNTEEEEEEEEEEDDDDDDEEEEITIDEFDSKFSDDEDEDEEEEEEDSEKEDEEVEEEEEEEDSEEVIKAKLEAKNEAYERKLREAEDKRWEEGMEKELKNMILQSMEQRKYEKVSRFNAPLPPKQQYTADENSGPNKMAFTLLSKNNANKTKKPVISTRRIDLPHDVKFASKILEETERQRNERDKLKSIVLNMKDD